MSVLNTTPEQETGIINRAIGIGSADPFTCGLSVSGAIGGVCGISGSFFPGSLSSQAEGASCK